MDNFNYKKYLAESRLLKEDQLAEQMQFDDDIQNNTNKNDFFFDSSSWWLKRYKR